MPRTSKLALFLALGFLTHCSNKAKKSDQVGAEYDINQGLGESALIRALVNQGTAQVSGTTISVTQGGSVNIQFMVDGGQITGVDVAGAPQCQMQTVSSVQCNFPSGSTVNSYLTVRGTNPSNQSIQQQFTFQDSNTGGLGGLNNGITPGEFSDLNQSGSGGLLGGILGTLGSGGGLLGNLLGGLTQGAGGGGILGSVISGVLGNSNSSGGGILSKIISAAAKLFGLGLTDSADEAIDSDLFIETGDSEIEID